MINSSFALATILPGAWCKIIWHVSDCGSLPLVLVMPSCIQMMMLSCTVEVNKLSLLNTSSAFLLELSCRSAPSGVIAEMLWPQFCRPSLFTLWFKHKKIDPDGQTCCYCCWSDCICRLCRPPRLLQVCFPFYSFKYPKVDKELFLPWPFHWCVIFSAAVEMTAFHNAVKVAATRIV